ncbi:MAG: hypothetical protein WKG07_16130 [Hymenobacter sp.]
MRYLYGVFHDWELVLAAYNWGAGSVQRVMRRTGKKNFWDLYPYMPAETRNYVPTFTAIMYSMKYADAHGLHSDKLNYQPAPSRWTRWACAGQAFDLRRLSRACGCEDSTYLRAQLRSCAAPRCRPATGPTWCATPAPPAAHLGDVDRATLARLLPGPRRRCRSRAGPRTPRLTGVEPFPTRPLLAATEGPRTDDEPDAPRACRLRHTVRRAKPGHGGRKVLT